ncbi:ubiquilin-1-like [Notolabrus celidotus]|uniref:ubiquilin-1-like n=1 Tax=Notolabrus celidotus TaxID=1203425 RepID=UPI0014902F02|nr:ubiquilin-1-like [Notolabrus celidotus]
MSGTVKDEPGEPSEGQRSQSIHVSMKSLKKSKAFTVRGNCTVRQLKRGLSARLEVPAELLLLIHSGRVLRESEVLSHLKAADGSVSISVVQRPQQSSAAPTSDPASEVAQSDFTDNLDPNPDNFTSSPTSPLYLVEALDGLDLTNSRRGFFPVLQQQMESQLVADPELLNHVLGSHFIQSTLSTSSPQLTRQMILSNPQIQQLLETNPEVGELINNADVITEVQELIKNPDMIETIMHNEDRALNNLQPEHENPKTITRDSDSDLKSDTKRIQSQFQVELPTQVTSSKNQPPPEMEKGQTPPFSSHCTDPLRNLTATCRDDPTPQSPITPGMQSLLEEITTSPGLIESLLSGPYVSSLLNCLSQNPDLAAQMLLSHPLFSGNPLLQQQIRQQIPLYLQQMQSPELLSAMLNPRAMEALLQIQQALQTLATEVPALIAMGELGNIQASVDAPPASDSALKDQSGNCPGVVTVTEQQQQFVQQMLQALADTNGVHAEEFQ